MSGQPDAPSAPDFYSCLSLCLSVCLSVLSVRRRRDYENLVRMAHPGKYISSVIVVVVVFVVVVVLVIVVFVVGVVGSCHVHENVFYPDAPSAPDFYSCLVVCLSVCLSVCLYVCSLVVVVLCV